MKICTLIEGGRVVSRSLVGDAHEFGQRDGRLHVEGAVVDRLTAPLDDPHGPAPAAPVFVTAVRWAGAPWAGACPKCGGLTVVTMQLYDEDGRHQHTRYVCNRWPKGSTTPCGWWGWTIPNTPIHQEDMPMETDKDMHERVEHALTNHPPANDDVIAAFEAIRKHGKALSHAIIELCPPSRDRSVALTAVEDATRRAVAAIALDQDEATRRAVQYLESRF